MSSVTFHGKPDAVLGWDGSCAYVTEDVMAGAPPPARLDGLAAAVQSLHDGAVRIFRDRLGIGKLFWARASDGRLVIAARPVYLIRAGYPLQDIMAVPRGVVLRLDSRGKIVSERAWGLAVTRPEAVAPSLEAVGARIRGEIDAYLDAIASTYPNRRAFICLSGGMDSSTLAVLAKRHFPELIAVSFDLAGSSRGQSEDRLAAQRLAKDLGIPLIEATVSVEQLLAWIDLALVEAIDWRDFNIHCGLVNAGLAHAIAAECKGTDEPPLVLTGDLANEFLVDYHVETYRGAIYYSLPRVERDRLRNVLIQGLETCHREVGVFGAWGLTVVQPYAVCVDAYLSLSPSFLRHENRKEILVREIVGSELPDYIYHRPKVRAQIGGSDVGCGTLAACIDRGIDAAFLRRRFARIHQVTNDSELDRFIRAGRYRVGVPAPKEHIHAPI